MLKDVFRPIERHNRFVLTSHAQPASDAIGSALAFRQILRAMGKNADVVLRDGETNLPAVAVCSRSCPVGDGQRRLRSCDHSRVRQYPAYPAARTREQVSDQHRSSPERRPFGQVNWIDPEAVATAEMVYGWRAKRGQDLSAKIATCLYTAVLTDTGIVHV